MILEEKKPFGAHGHVKPTDVKDGMSVEDG